jgi:nucleotide-binding universal stress UspA family protein
LLTGDRDLLSVQRRVHEKRTELLSTVLEVTERRIDLASARVHLGSAAETILREARNVSADVIVLGAHRDRGIADRVLGSTAEHVLRRAEVPCLVLNGPLSLPLRRILVPSDLAAQASGVAATALGWADLLCQNGDADVILAHVADPAVDLDGSPEVRPDLIQKLRSTATEASRGAGWKLPLRTQLLQAEDPAREISEYANALGAGLIVLGTKGDPVIVRALLGSVSSAVVRTATLPVLLVPPAPRVIPNGRARAPSPDSLAESIAV